MFLGLLGASSGRGEAPHAALLACLLAVGCEAPLAVGYEDEPVPLYGTFELVFRDGSAPDADEHTRAQAFETFGEVAFERSGRTQVVEAFYDGDGSWRARFMPDETGLWRFHYRLGEAEGTGSFRCRGAPVANNHGHVHRDPAKPGLHHDDGSEHLFFGGKWFSAKNYGPLAKNGIANNREEQGSYHDAYLADAQLLPYLDQLAATGHNGVVLNLSLFPLEEDGISWDLEWVRRAESWVREFQRRGIYVQMNLFDPAGRLPGEPFLPATPRDRQLLDGWNPGQEREKENYLRTVVARFAGFANVYWELGNRVGLAELDERAFVQLAESQYLPWLRKYDVYDLPVGLSDQAAAWATSADIALARQSNSGPDASFADRPVMITEYAESCRGESMVADATLRNAANRGCYRRAMWTSFLRGALGTAEASWLDLRRGTDAAVLAVMEDLSRLRWAWEQLPGEWATYRPALDRFPVVEGESLGLVGARTNGEGAIAALFDWGAGVPDALPLSLPYGDFRWVLFDPAGERQALYGQFRVTSARARLGQLPNWPEAVLLVIPETFP